jgi:hypothetical protein
MKCLEKITVNKVNQQVSSHLWNQNAHYSVDKNLQLASVPNHTTSLRTLRSCLSNIQF